MVFTGRHKLLRRENTVVQLAYYQHNLKQGYDANVKLRPLAPSDSVAGIGVYFLEDLDEHVIPRPWNVKNMNRYYY